MPVSHIGLTVSHLPTSTSFFLSALHPLGYKYIGQHGNEVGLGVTDADFFLCQETPGIPAGAAHIAFSAPSRIAVRDFYTAALTAGGRPNGAPAVRDSDNGYFNAAIMDPDGNSIEVVFREGTNAAPADDDAKSKVLSWRQGVAGSKAGSVIDDKRSVVSSVKSLTQDALVLADSSGKSKAPSVVSSRASVQRSVTAPVMPALAYGETKGNDVSTKTIIGTILGAAAGAAIGYAMCKSEEDSAKEESKFFAAAKELAKKQFEAAMPALASVSAPAPQPQVQQMDQVQQQQFQQMQMQMQMQSMQHSIPQGFVYEPSASSPSQVGVSRQMIDQQAYFSPAASEYNAYPQQRAIEAPPSVAGSQRAPTYVSATASQPQRAATYVSAAPSQVQRAATYVSAAPSQASYASEQRSVVYGSRPIASAQTVYTSPPRANSTVASTLIKTFVPSEAGDQEPDAERRSSVGTAVSQRTVKSKHTSASKQVERRSSAPSVHSVRTITEEAPGKAPTIIGSTLGRSNTFPEEEIILSDNDNDSIAPCDSISNVGSNHTRRTHRSSHSKHRSRADSKVDSGDDKQSRVSRHTAKPVEENDRRCAITQSVIDGRAGSTHTAKPVKEDDKRSTVSSRTVKAAEEDKSSRVSRRTKVAEEDDKRSVHSRHTAKPVEDDDKRSKVSRHTKIAEEDDKRSVHSSRTVKAADDDKRSTVSTRTVKPADDDDKKSTHSRHSKHSSHSKAKSTAGSKAPEVMEITIEEASEAGTVKPSKKEPSEVSTVKPSKKASSVASLPVRAITQSVIDGRSGGKRSVVSYAGGN